MSSFFDGMAAIFRDTLGRPVIYTPLSTGVALDAFDVIYIVRPIDIAMGGDAASDGIVRTLGLAIADVAAPVEGDLVSLPATDSESAEGPFKVVPPIQHDGKGMVTVMLERTT